jgi:SAM-dependent methyltransferase
MDEIEEIRRRYRRRDELGLSARYDPLRPASYMAQQERVRAFIRLFQSVGLVPLRDKKLLEVGCGNGDVLLDLIRLGFAPEKVAGNELLDHLAAEARTRLPAATRVLPGSAADLVLPPASFHIVLQSMMFSSVLDDDFQHQLAATMWRLVRPGGGVLWYDFVYNNPRNPDVRGVPLRRVRALFPAGRVRTWRLTLAPPLARLVTSIHPALYSAFNLLPLHTHVMAWIEKDAR